MLGARINSLLEERQWHLEEIKVSPDKRKLIKNQACSEIERVVKPGEIDWRVSKDTL